MRIQCSHRTISLAAMAALTLAAIVIAGPVHAQPFVPRGSYPPCAYFNRNSGEWEFYGPGDGIYVQDSAGHDHQLTCINGQWQDGGIIDVVGGGTTLPIGGASIPLSNAPQIR